MYVPGSQWAAYSQLSQLALQGQAHYKQKKIIIISVNSLHDYFHTVFMLKECKLKIILTFMQFSSKGRHPLH